MHSDTPIQITAMGEKHHLTRQEDKAQTRLRGLTLWTTALLWPEEVGGRGRGDGWVNYSLGGWGGDLDWGRLSRQQDETGNQNQWWKQTHCQRTPTARKTKRTVLFINIRKEIKHETTEKSSKNLKYQLISQWCKLEKQCLQRPQNGLVTTSHAAKMLHS